jgi:hypothetical protein
MALLMIMFTGANAGYASYAQKDHALVRSSSFKENKTHTK